MFSLFILFGLIPFSWVKCYLQTVILQICRTRDFAFIVVVVVSFLLAIIHPCWSFGKIWYFISCQNQHLARTKGMKPFKYLLWDMQLWYCTYSPALLFWNLAGNKKKKKREKKLFKIIWQVIILFNVKCSSDKLIELDLCTKAFCKPTVYLISLPPLLRSPLCH